MAKRRTFSTFNLSFLDIMSCGFGAVALIFLILKHDIDKQANELPNDLSAEVNLLQEDIRAAKANKVAAKNTLSQLNQEQAITEGLARRINDDIEAIRTLLAELSPSDDASMEALKQRLQDLQEEKQQLEEDMVSGNDVRQFTGQGQRQYLTGLKLGGRRILILLDSSASMLDETIINIIRMRNMPAAQRRKSEKWQRAVRTVEWLVAKFPVDSQYQIYGFNQQTKALLKGTQGQWLSVAEKPQLEKVIQQLHQLTPANGTNLAAAFETMAALPQRPDNVFLITDGLPTQGARPASKGTISGAERVKLFNRAIDQLPRSVPLNIILAPMEGDPMAAGAFWQLAIQTRGSFMSPSKDWP